MKHLGIALLLSGLAVVPVHAQTRTSADVPRPSIPAAARTGDIAIDGRIDEDAWAAAQPATGFLQQEPDEGQPAQRTEVRFLYDDDALYIGARMYDDVANGVRTRLGRRDEYLEGDYLLFVLDTFHDHTGRTMFQINPSGVKYDAGQASSFADESWDPVWQAATHVDSAGWTAELRIPFSQLRFQSADVQTWGMQIWRYTERLAESSMWAFWGRNESGGPQLFGHLEQLRVPERSLGVELLPYIVARAERVTPPQADNPFDTGETNSWRVGGDVKAILGSALTLDATINPDFGQVEVDPAVVNLSAFETFFEEKRPFFVEGSGLFGFGSLNCYFCSNVSSLSLFYSRRIGRTPQGAVTGAAEYVSVPENTTILGAAKVTARTSSGWQLGVLDAVTSSEHADAERADLSRFTEEVEPMTNYFVGRLRRNFRDGNLQVGAIATSVIRRFDNDALRSLLTSHAEAVGVDWQALWKDRTYSWMGQLALTSVVGDSLAIRRLQQAPARYFQRPDRDEHGNGFLTNGYDTSLEQLRGIGGYTRFAKIAGDWQFELQSNFRTPGFENNDLAFLTRADYVWTNGNLRWQLNRPTRYSRYLSFTAGGQRQYNFDGDLTDAQIHASGFYQLLNYWGLGAFVIRYPERPDERATRGGPVIHRASGTFYAGNIGSDSRKALVVSLDGNAFRAKDGGREYGLRASIRYKPATNLAFTLGPSLSAGTSVAQFVDRFTDPTATAFHGQRVVFSELEHRTLSMTTRISATFSPTLTLEVFAQPFISSGDYDAFKEYTAPRTTERRLFDASRISAIPSAAGRDSVYVLDADGDAGTAAFTFRNPDFNFRSLRGNAVLRWEYRPGSTLYLVWQQQRAGRHPFGDFSLSRDADGVFSSRPDNIFLMKVSYWFGR
ncbi:MAG TPA: DUF5916 domain-containing protein [Longimicrobiales bacterium]